MFSQAPAAAQDDFEGLPLGEGVEDVYYTCQACHSLKLVLQQRLNRSRWDYTLNYMVEEQGMPELEAAERERILSYLSQYLGQDVPR